MFYTLEARTAAHERLKSPKSMGDLVAAMVVADGVLRASRTPLIVRLGELAAKNAPLAAKLWETAYDMTPDKSALKALCRLNWCAENHRVPHREPGRESLKSLAQAMMQAELAGVFEGENISIIERLEKLAASEPEWADKVWEGAYWGAPEESALKALCRLKWRAEGHRICKSADSLRFWASAMMQAELAGVFKGEDVSIVGRLGELAYGSNWASSVWEGACEAAPDKSALKALCRLKWRTEEHRIYNSESTLHHLASAMMQAELAGVFKGENISIMERLEKLAASAGERANSVWRSALSQPPSKSALKAQLSLKFYESFGLKEVNMIGHWTANAQARGVYQLENLNLTQRLEQLAQKYPGQEEEIWCGAATCDEISSAQRAELYLKQMQARYAKFPTPQNAHWLCGSILQAEFMRVVGPEKRAELLTPLVESPDEDIRRRSLSAVCAYCFPGGAGNLPRRAVLRLQGLLGRGPLPVIKKCQALYDALLAQNDLRMADEELKTRLEALNEDL